MLTKQQFQVKYFRKQLKEIDFQLREMEAAGDGERTNHVLYISELLHSLLDEFIHADQYKEDNYGQLCEAWKDYQKRFPEYELVLNNT